MNGKAISLTLALLLMGGAGWWWRLKSERHFEAPKIEKTGADSASRPALTVENSPSEPRPSVASIAAENVGANADKRARIAKIKHDYDELAAKLSAEFGAADKFPGGLNGYLRQLALLEREKRADYARLLTPEELEDLELHETRAGREVQRWLNDAAITDEQRRAVFRLQREFDDKYALEFDLARSALLARESERQALQEKILGVLGPEAFAAWLRGEGRYFGDFARFTAQRGLVPEKAIELWRVKNEFVRQDLMNQAQSDATSEQLTARRAALIAATKERINQIVGPGAFEVAEPETFAWLERRK